MTDFAGKTILVTGGSSGIGLATAKAFAALGADVGVVARDAGRLETARREIEAARRDGGQKVATAAGDVSKADQAEASIESVISEIGVPDILLNTAGIIIPGYFEKMPVEDFTTCMDCGYYTVLYPCRVVAPRMMERGSGHIVNVSSVAGFLGVFGYTAYASAKYAVMGFTESLRSELKPYGVKTSVVCPPDTDTPGLAFEKTLRPVETDRVAGNIKPVSAEFVAKAIVSGVAKGRYLIIPGVVSKLYFRIKNIVPWLFFTIIDGDVQKARKERLSGVAGPVAETGD